MAVDRYGTVNKMFDTALGYAGVLDAVNKALGQTQTPSLAQQFETRARPILSSLPPQGRPPTLSPPPATGLDLAGLEKEQDIKDIQAASRYADREREGRMQELGADLVPGSGTTPLPPPEVRSMPTYNYMLYEPERPPQVPSFDLSGFLGNILSGGAPVQTPMQGLPAEQDPLYGEYQKDVDYFAESGKSYPLSFANYKTRTQQLQAETDRRTREKEDVMKRIGLLQDPTDKWFAQMLYEKGNIPFTFTQNPDTGQRELSDIFEIPRGKEGLVARFYPEEQKGAGNRTYFQRKGSWSGLTPGEKAGVRSQYETSEVQKKAQEQKQKEEQEARAKANKEKQRQEWETWQKKKALTRL